MENILTVSGRFACVIVMLGFVAGCGSKEAAVREQPVEDREFELASRAARLAFDQGRYEQAAKLYTQVLEMAYTRDDLAAIIDSQYNAAVCQVKLDDYDAALTFVGQARAELSRDARPLPVDFSLLEATILYRQGNRAPASAIVDRIVAQPAKASGQAIKRAQFLRGLIASEHGDQRRLTEAIAALGTSTDPRLEADYQELTGHLALAEQRHTAAFEAFTEAARLRTETVDYRGTVRALAMAGEAAEASGEPKAAASHFLRAGRSAALQKSNQGAEKLLLRAERLALAANEPSIAEEARQLLAGLRRSGK